jgi:hypothetical protein
MVTIQWPGFDEDGNPLPKGEADRIRKAEARRALGHRIAAHRAVKASPGFHLSDGDLEMIERVLLGREPI